MVQRTCGARLALIAVSVSATACVELHLETYSGSFKEKWAFTASLTSVSSRTCHRPRVKSLHAAHPRRSGVADVAGGVCGRFAARRSVAADSSVRR